MTEEDYIQKGLVDWLGNLDPLRYFFFAIPNGGKRHLRTAKTLKATGTRAGMPDLVLIIKGKPSRVVFLEVKTLKGSTSIVQKGIHLTLRQFGFQVEVIKAANYIDAIAQVKNLVGIA